MKQAYYSANFLGCVAAMLFAPLAHAGTFEDALSAAYERNPRIKQERERLQATDEGVAQAAAGFRPTISAAYQRGRQETNFNGGPDVTSNSEHKSLRVEQPLYRGGGTMSALNSARQRVKAGQYDLMATEQQVLLDAVTAYMNVIMASGVLNLSQQNERVLNEQVSAADERFKVGEVTRTDLAQSQSRLMGARASTLASEGQLVSAVASFERIMGYRPSGNMAIPTTLPELPLSLEDALERGRSASPQLLSALHSAKSALYDVRSNEAVLLPRASLVGSLSRDDGVGATGANQFYQDRIGVEVTIPIYQAGSEWSRVRQAQAVARQRDQASIDIRQSVDEAVSQAWEQLETATASIAAWQAQIRASEMALDGVKQEHQFGVRTLLDVLNAEQELFAARTNLVRAERDRVVAGHTLAFRLGQLYPSTLGVTGVTYNPQEHADDVAWKFIGY